jgi:DnaK suppressor protein
VLERERQRHEVLLAVLTDDLVSLQSEADAGRPGSRRAVAGEEWMLITGLVDHYRWALDEIAGAADRVDAGTYGICERCQEVVDAGRLRALPAARLCSVCQSDLRSGLIPSIHSRSAVRRAPGVFRPGPAGC